MSESTTISYNATEKEGLVGKAYSIWIEENPGLNPIIRGVISSLWENNKIHLVVPKDKLNE
jgi:hypothetical protein